MNIDIVSDQLRGLSEKRIRDILKYIAYLKYLDSSGAGTAEDNEGALPSSAKIDRSAIFNCMPDIVIGDDFDAPMEEFEEYM